MTYIIEEIASYMMVGDDSIESDENLEDKLMEQFNVDFNSLEEIVDKLLPMCMSGISGINNTLYCGLADKKSMFFIAKVEDGKSMEQ